MKNISYVLVVFLLFLTSLLNAQSRIDTIVSLKAQRFYSPIRTVDGSYGTGVVSFEFQVPVEIPVINGSSGNHKAEIQYLSPNGKWDKISYTGNAVKGRSGNAMQGNKYLLDNNGGNPVQGTILKAKKVILSIKNGDKDNGSPTEVELPLPLAVSFTFQVIRCSNGPVQLIMNSNDPISSVVWNPGNVTAPFIGAGGGFTYRTLYVDPTYRGPYSYTVRFSDGTTFSRTVTALMESNVTAPTVNAGIDQSRATCLAPHTFNIAGVVSGSLGTGTWSSPTGGTFGNANNLSTTYTFSAADIANGTVTLTLSSRGYVCNATDQVVLSIPLPATVNAGTDLTICNASIVNLNGIIGGGSTGAIWSGGAGTFSNVNALNSTYSPTPAEISSGSVVLTLTATGSPCGNVSDQKMLNFYVNPVFTVPPVSVYCGTTATLTANSAVAGVTYNWTPQGGGALLTGNPVTTPVLTANKTYLVSASLSGNPCIVNRSIIVQVLGTPAIHAVGGSTVTCNQAFTVAINDTPSVSPLNTFEWLQSGIVVGTGDTYTATPPVSSSTQTLLFRLRMNGNAGCISNAVTITANPCGNCSAVNLSPKWATYFGGSGFDEISEIAVKSNNNIVVLGNTDGLARNLPTTGSTVVRDIGTSSGSGFGEVFLAEISADGQAVVWIDYIHIEAPANVVSLALDKTDDNVYLAIQHQTGSLAPYDYTYLGSGGAQQNSLLRLDAGGAVSWRKQYFMSGTMQVMTSGNDGHLYIGGSAFGVLASSPNIADLPAILNGGLLAQQNVTSGDMFVLKVSKANATDVWSQLLDYYRIVGSTNPCSQSSETPNKIIQGSLGELYICGAQSDNNCQGGGFATKGLAYNVRQNGSIGWAKLYTGTQAFDQYTGICEDQGTLALVGLRNANGFGPNGLIGSDIYLERLALATGTSQATRVIGGSDTDVQHGITADGSGKIYVTGYTASSNISASFQAVNPSVMFYHGNHTSYQPLAPSPVNSQDIFVGRFSGNNFIPDWFTYYGSGSTVKSYQNNDIGYDLVLDNSGNLYVVGSTKSLDFQVASPTQAIYQGNQDGAIVKLGCTNGLRESELISENSLTEMSIFSVHPNPFSSSFVISLPEDRVYKLELTDSKGNKIFEQNNVVNATEILIDHLESGLYNLRLLDVFETRSYKLIKIE